MSKVYVVPNRNKDTMQQIFLRSCNPRAKIYHDGWAAYNAVNWGLLNMEHEENVYINPRTGFATRTMTHQYLIESLWSTIKYHSTSIYNTRPGDDHLENFLFEAVWRRNKNMLPVCLRNGFVQKCFSKINERLRNAI